MDQEISRKRLFEQLARLYADMEKAYDRIAKKIGLSCEGCPDNCCDSYFRHHTYIEWAYLWEGIRTYSVKERRELVARAQEYVEHCLLAKAQGKKPNMMCPLNEEGLCRLYKYRLMICRMHGVPNRLVRPDGQEMTFPGYILLKEFSGLISSVETAELR